MTNHTCITIDFYNSSFSIKINDVHHWWNDAESFITDTGFPFKDTVRIFSYEPERKIFHIERPDATTNYGNDADEFRWFDDNLATLTDLISTKMAENTQVVTMAMIRQGNLYVTDWVLQRHTEEELLGLPPTMAREKLLEVMRYRQALRDLSKSYALDTPADRVSWPVSPMG